MVNIGEIYLGRKDGPPFTNKAYPSGVAFYLTKSSPFSEILQTDDGKWELEVKENHQVIVARSMEVVPIEQILSDGYSHCQKFLDLLTIFHHNAIMIKNPGTDFVALFDQAGRCILRESSNADLGVATSATLTIYDKNGKIKENPPEPKPQWIPAFRYYRLSQSSSDLYEAYRNLFLSFESLLYGICPVNSGEKENQWLIRALTEVMKKVPLQSHVPPNTTDPVRCIVGTQYEHIRCKMFHSKDRGYILPYEDLDPKSVSEAYQNLIRLWREIVGKCYNISIGGGGVTYQGFKVWMDAFAAPGFSMYITDDSTPFLPEDTSISPQNHQVYPACEVKYSGDYRSGMVLIKGTFKSETFSKLDVIHRIGTMVNQKLMFVSHIQDGIRPSGVDIFESDVTLRLINKSSPKTIFS